MRFVSNTYGYRYGGEDCKSVARTLLIGEWKQSELKRIAQETLARRQKEEQEQAEREARRNRDREALEALARDRKQREKEEKIRRKQEQNAKALQAKRARREARKFEDRPRDEFGRFIARDEAQRRSLRQRSARANAQPSGLLAGLVARVEPPARDDMWAIDWGTAREDLMNANFDTDWTQQLVYTPATAPTGWSTSSASAVFTSGRHYSGNNVQWTIHDEVQLAPQQAAAIQVDEGALRTALDRVVRETGLNAPDLIRPATEEEVRTARERMRAIGINNPEWDL